MMATVDRRDPIVGADVLISGIVEFVSDFETLAALLHTNLELERMLVEVYSTQKNTSIGFWGPCSTISVHDNSCIDFFLKHNRVAALCSKDFKYVCFGFRCIHLISCTK